MIRRHSLPGLLLALPVLLCLPVPAASPAAPAATSPAPVPDLTQSVDFERKGEFHLGPTGAMGWVHTAKNFMTTEARQILITQVEPGSAADGVLAVGDVVLGTGVEKFTTDARRALGEAIDDAEREENGGVLTLLRWRPVGEASPRKGETATVALPLRVMGAYSDTAPWDCPKSGRILEDALKVIVERGDMGRFGANALALLATGEEKYIAIVRDYIHAQKWAKPDLQLSVEQGGMVSWPYGYQNLLLTEYFLLTGDEHVLPAIREYAVKTAMGQSHGGTWGHGFAWTSINDGKLHGRLKGYGALNQAGLPCYLSLLLAKKCGVEHPEVDAAIVRAADFFKEFVDNGSIGYGYHRPSLEIHASGRNGMSGNGKNGVAAVAFRVAGEEEPRRFFTKLTASLYNTCEYGHSGNSYSYFWDPLGANCGGPDLAAAFLKELRWYHALTRKADGSFVHQPLGGHYGGKFLEPTAAQILIATLPRRAIHLTGKGQTEGEWLGPDEIRETIAAGRWRLADIDAMSVAQLIGELDAWSPIAREWAAKALATKEGDFTKELIQLMRDGGPEARAGAAAALGHLGDRAAGAVPHLAKALSDEEDIVSIAAGYALARIGEPARSALPDLMRAVLTCDEDGAMRPRQQALAYSFGHVQARTAPLYFNGLLAQVAEDGNPLDDLDRPLLHATITKLLNAPCGRTRGCGAYAFRYFSREDVAAMAQPIHDAITVPTMSYMMFADAPRHHALDLMARFHLKEGLPLCFETFDFKSWGAYARFPARFGTLQAYAGSARPFLPQLVEMRERWKSGEHRDMLEETIKIIEEDENPVELISIHDLVAERLARDLAPARDKQEKLVLCRQLMKKHPHDTFYQAAGKRLISSLGKKK
jgi:hypothetical protein